LLLSSDVILLISDFSYFRMNLILASFCLSSRYVGQLELYLNWILGVKAAGLLLDYAKNECRRAYAAVIRNYGCFWSIFLNKSPAEIRKLVTCVRYIIKITASQNEITLSILCQHFIECFTRKKTLSKQHVIEYSTNTEHV
jgi:hypothetical protein